MIKPALGLVDKAAPSFAKLRVSVQRGGKTSRVDFEDATVVEVRAAVRALNPNKPAPKKNSDAALITRALAAAKLKGLTVLVTRSGITFRGLTVEKLQSLANVLLRIKLPSAEPHLRRVA